MSRPSGAPADANEPEPSANLGYSRLRWVEPGSPKPFAIVLTPLNCDFVALLIEAFGLVGLDAIDARRWTPKKIADAMEKGTARDAGSHNGNEAPRLLILEQAKASFDLAIETSRNSPWIVCFDDVCASALSAESHKTALDATLIGQAERQLQCVRAVERHGGDLMVASLRKMREFPDLHLKALMNFVGAAPVEDALTAAAGVLSRADEPYALSSRKQLPSTLLVRGMVDKLCNRGVVAGWAKDVLDERRIEIRVLVEGEEVARELADFEREDLKKRNLGDGAYGFAIDIGRFLGAEPKQVEVRTVERDFTVGLLEMTLRRGLRIDPTE